MARILFLTDFSEQYAHELLKGVAAFAKSGNPWVLCKMPMSFRERHGLEGVLAWAKKWKADAVIGQFLPDDNVSIFRNNGIIALAQDYVQRFDTIVNITGDHIGAGAIGAEHFIQKGFGSFAFYGVKDIVWSEERKLGFQNAIKTKIPEAFFSEYLHSEIEDFWHYDSLKLLKWLMSMPKPVAIMACDDNHGHHIIELCSNYGIRVPEEIAVLGVDNDEIVCSLSNPPLSSLGQSVEKGGYDAACLIQNMLDNPAYVPSDIIVQPIGVVTRQSSDVYATSDNFIAIILKYIHQNVETKFCIDDLLRHVPLSRRLLELKFKKVTGQAIYQYVMTLRIERFAQRLLDSQDPVIDIAMEMEFADYKNIARQFKKLKGCSPLVFRNKHAPKAV